MTTKVPTPDPSSRYTASGSANTVAASGKETPCFLRFDSAFAESHSKSPSMIVGTPRPIMGHIPYCVKAAWRWACPANAQVHRAGASPPDEAETSVAPAPVQPLVRPRLSHAERERMRKSVEHIVRYLPK
jgi:hypothetical protein